MSATMSRMQKELQNLDKALRPPLTCTVLCNITQVGLEAMAHLFEVNLNSWCLSRRMSMFCPLSCREKGTLNGWVGT